MEQHPVPQPITSYEFRLVGDMTLKQFGKLAAGVTLALIVYAINPPSFFKWFFILLFSGVGAAAAFVPFEGRPIDVWIIAFFKRIYSPTQYVWKQRGGSASPTVNKSPSVSAAQAPAVEAKPVSLPAPPPAVPAFTPAAAPKPAPATIFRAAPAPKIFTPPPASVAPKVEAKFASSITIPATPSTANLLSGFIHDTQGKIIEGAILEIRDATGNPVRAFKTNKLGQFQSATPLPSGTYEVEAEKEGFSFDIIKVGLKGEILSPIEIVSK